MTDQPTLAVIGTGGLARSICYALAVCGTQPIRVLVAGRDHGRAAEVCYVAAARAAAAGVPVTFQPLTVDPACDRSLADTLGVGAPTGVLVAASSQSPWERQNAPSAWTELVQRAGFGLTLPFQAEPALRVGRALAATHPEAWLINACFPDAANQVLAAAGVPALCGIGNGALIAASIQAALGLPDQRRLRVLAHHVHLHTPSEGEEEALAWYDGQPVAEVGKLLAAQRAATRSELNHVTGYAAAQLVRDLLAGAETDTTLPGVLGLPGGYPVRLSGTRLELRLPAGVSRAEAVAFNSRAALRDGVVVDDGRVRFGPTAQEELSRLVPELAEGFPISDIEAVTHRLDQLRTRLRNQPPRYERGTQTMPSPVPTVEAETVTPVRSANLLIDFYDRLPAAIAACGGDVDPVRDGGPFSPGFLLPELDDDLRRFLSAATAEWRHLGMYGTHRLSLLDLTGNPGTGTTKTFASLLIVARAVEYIRRYGEPVSIFSPTSANKGVALRDAVLRAIEAGLVDPELLRVVILAPQSCLAKLRSSRLSTDPTLRALNPMLLYTGPEPEHVKAIGREFVDRYAAEFQARGHNLWFSLELGNYLVADTVRAFFEHDADPISAPRLHAHAVSSAFGLLGYHKGREVLEATGQASRDTRPASLLVQHMGTPDMVLNLRHGDFDRGNLPAYRIDPADGLYRQSADPHFPQVTYDPDEILDPTFYTHRPATSPAMNELIGRFGGEGIVVSLAECVQRYPHLRDLLAGTGCALPADFRTLREWSMVMALTGVLNAVDRGLIDEGRDIVVHGTGCYTSADYQPLEPDAMIKVSGVEDVLAAVRA
ncbi:DUF6002 family protein [Microtetraspora sp. NBRC 16547]|uniref:DUF6002 family protein n=1 Tax=Microtetraspora sp. NBRC 16547 TaxID=3030993 RepID=UPI0025555DAE|nr:DUF6002 family protein [Microtetraspora sp. NBRC 16547]